MYKIEVNKINEFNQLAKKVSTEYFIFSDGTILFINDDKHLSYGEHFGKMDVQVFSMIEEKQIFCINSKDIFKVIQENKKHIKYLTISKDKILLTDEKGDNVFQIGTLTNINSLTKELVILYKIALNKINEFNNTNKIILSDDIIKKLNSKNIITFSENNYKIRLTSKLIPLMLKSIKNNIYFKDIINSNLFESLIVSETNYFNLFHKYTCIKY